MATQTTNNKLYVDESDVKNFKIISNEDGKEASIRSGITEFAYYESIRQNTIRVNVTYVDAGVDNLEKGKTLLEALPLVGSEKCRINFVDNNGVYIGGKKELYLFVNKVTPLIDDTRKQMVTLDLVSKEFIMNEKGCTRILKRHDGKISDSIRSIFEKNINTDKDLDIEDTENNFNFIPNNKKPMYTLNWLSKKSVPIGKKGKSAGFFFWETSNGFHFRSIDWLMDKEKNKPKKSIIFNDTTKGKEIPEGYQLKALDFQKDNKIDVQHKFMMGFQSTRIILFNPFDGYYQVAPSEASTESLEVAGKKLPQMNRELNCAGNGKNYTRTTYYVKDTGTLNQGNTTAEQVEKSTEQNFDYHQIENQAIRRYNQLYSAETTVTIPGDFSLHAGNAIFIDGPSVQIDTDNDDVDKQYSGDYIISDLVHYIDHTGPWTKLVLIRDSFGRKGKASDTEATNP